MYKTITILLLFFCLHSNCQNFPWIDSSVSGALLPTGLENPRVQFRNFKATTLGGTVYSPDSLTNKICFISFWSVSCMPCIAEFDSLNGVYKKYRNDRNFLFLSFTYEEPGMARDVVRKYHLEYPVICVSQEEIYRMIFNLGFPTLMITNKKADITYIKCGGFEDKDKAQEEINSMFVTKLDKLLFRN